MPGRKKETESNAPAKETAAKKSGKNAKEELVLNMENNEILMYKGKPLVRQDDVIIYGNPEDPYLVSFTIHDKKPAGDLMVATNVVVQLMMNGHNEDVTKNRPVKRAEREGFYDALDIGVYWLEDILKQVKK